MLDESEVTTDDEDRDDSEVVDKLIEELIVELLVSEALDDDKTVDVDESVDVNAGEVVVNDDVKADEVPDERSVTIVAFHPLVGTEESRLDVEVAPTAPASDAWLVEVDVEDILLGQMVSRLGQIVMRLGVSSVETGQIVTTLGVVSAVGGGQIVTTLGVDEPAVIVTIPGTPGVVISSGHGVERVAEPSPGGVAVAER
ncbi:hypothetical protein PG991_007267 [Apiospora marii]|uniref:Uncharacterized protein n=1 Tax=Apiospora marii TaxID=335849 RepID=A0ABR1RT65_9PEZI